MAKQSSEGKVSLWLARDIDRATFDRYLDDTAYYSSEDENLPVNQFAADFGIADYDHDFQEAFFSECGPVPIRELLADCSYGNSFIAAAVQQSQELGWHIATAFVLLYDGDCVKQHSPADKKMTFIGSFSYTKT